MADPFDAQADAVAVQAVASSAAPRRGHAPQPSVGIAASLFDASADDPFASIASPATPSRPSQSLGALPEEAEGSQQPAADAPSDLFSGTANSTDAGAEDVFGPSSTSVRSAQQGGDLLEVPTASTTVSPGSAGPLSPSKLFAASPSYQDDWLGGSGADTETDVPPLDDTTEAAAVQNTGSLDFFDGGSQSHPEAGPDQVQHNGYGYDAQYDYSQQGQFDGPAQAYGGVADQGYADQGYADGDYAGQGYSHQGPYAQHQQYGDHGYHYDYSFQQQQQDPQQQGQYDYTASQYSAEQQHSSDQSQNQGAHDPHSQSQSHYDQTQGYGQGNPSPHQGQDSYGAYDAVAYGQPTDTAYDTSGLGPQHDPSVSSGQPSQAYGARSSYDQGYSYDAPAVSYDVYSAQHYEQAQDQQNWPDQAQAATAYDEPQNGYGAYQPGSAVAQGQAYNVYDQPSASQTAESGAGAPPSAAGDRVRSPYDPVPATTSTMSAVRAPSPYGPPPAIAQTGVTLLSPASPHTASGLPLAPPPGGPPTGPPRGPARSPKAASSGSAAPATYQTRSETGPETGDDVPYQALEAEASVAAPTSAQHDAYGWQSGGEAPLVADQGNWPESGQGTYEDRRAGAYGHGAPGWLDQLEDAAATPPAVEDGPVPPMLTITDEDASPSAAFADETGMDPSGIRLGEDHVRSGEQDDDGDGRSREPLQPINAEQIDQAVEALRDLDLNGQEHVDDGLEQSVQAEAVATDELDELTLDTRPKHDSDALDGTSVFQEDGFAAGYDEGQMVTSPYDNGYSSAYQSQSADPYAPRFGSSQVPTRQSYGLDAEQEASSSEAVDPYAPRAATAGAADGSHASGASAGYAHGYDQSQWTGQAGSEALQEAEHQGYSVQPSSQYDPYAPIGPTSSHLSSSYEQANGPDAEQHDEDARRSYDSYGSLSRTQASTAQSEIERSYDDHYHQQGRPPYEDDADVKTPNATTSPTSWPGATASYDVHAAPYGPASVGPELGRNGATTQRSIGDVGIGTGSSFDASASAAPAIPRSSEDYPYGPSQGTLQGSQLRYGPRSDRPVTPGTDRHGEKGFFEEGYQYSSPQAAHFGGASGSTTGAPVSPYEPAKVAHSYTSEASYPSSATGSGIDMHEQMRNTRIPIVSFGFGGRLVTYFPNASAGLASDGDASYGGYGYGGASGTSTQVTVHALSTVIPSSSYASAFDPLQFPGPAFEGASVTALSRATGGANAGVKAKKVALLKHLDERIEEVSAGLGYLRRRPSFAALNADQEEVDQTRRTKLECQKAEDKLALLKLLRLILEHDAQTTNNATFDDAVRELLTGLKKGHNGSGPAAAASFAGLNGSAFGTSSAMPTASSGRTLRSYELKSGFLETMQDMLLRGERREAVDLAVEQKMWAHAMTIASCVDKDCWRNVVRDFIQHELGQDNANAAGESAEAAGGLDLQTLKVAYNVFSGQDPVSVFDLFRPKPQPTLLSPPPTAASAASATTSGSGRLPDWKGSAAIVISNQSANDSAALTAIGDGLAVHGLMEAAHFCYVLAPQTSPFAGIDHSAVRMTLLGAESPKTSTSYLQDLDSIILTEILEFAQSLSPIAKGQDAYAGIPHLQAYRLLHAYRLTELGDVQRAQKYCEAIAGALKLSKNSPYLHRTLLSQLKELSDRLLGAPQVNGSGNWMTRKMQRPTLDGVWGALEGRFTKFIAGDENDFGTSPARLKSTGAGANGPVGPFSHYTAITPDAARGGVSRQESYADLHAPQSRPQSRAGSAMDFHHTRRAASPKNRASSAMGMRGPPTNPFNAWPQPMSRVQPGNAPRGASFEASRNGYVLQSSAGSSYGGPDSFQSSAPSGNAPWYDQHGPDSRRPSTDTTLDKASSGDSSGYPGYSAYEQGEGEQFGGGGRDDVPYYGYQPHGAQQPQFVSNAEGPTLESAEDGAFLSPMDAFDGGGSRTPQPQTQTQTDHSSGRLNTYLEAGDEADDDDLGLGNSSRKKNAQQAESADEARSSSSYDPALSDKVEEREKERSKEPENKSELKPSASSSWLGRLWGRSSSSSVADQAKAKKAHLGEETAFYYDKDLKRWVNKKGGDSSGAATPPPPPPRAKTTSPAVGPDRGDGTASAPPMRGPSSNSASLGGPPPPRSSLSSYQGRATPPISEEGGTPDFGTIRNGAVLSRARSNLADHSMPPAAQPPLRSGSATPLGAGPPSATAAGLSPPPPPPGSRMGTVKKRPIKSRYVVVD